MASIHGGRLNQAAREQGIPVGEWLDLSTGINPHPWPVPSLPARAWQRLPEPDDGLAEAALDWAGTPSDAGCLPVAGTQAAIQALPRLRRASRIGVPRPGYNEHADWWRAAGHEVIPFDELPCEQHLAMLDGLVWINPNNPTGEIVSRERLLQCHEALAGQDGWLVVDEAFMDPDPSQTLLPESGRPRLIVLRSLGKFFGLAGLRGGLVFACPPLCRELKAILGPWAVSHPARYIMRQALRDLEWQRSTRHRLNRDSRRLAAMLVDAGLVPAGGTALFAYCPHERPRAVADALAAHAVLVRVFESPPALRFGLPGNESEWRQLERALGGL